MYSALQINSNDNVAVAASAIEAGGEILITGTEHTVIAKEFIKSGHKIALEDLKKGDTIIKYGIPIGRLKEDVEKGGWIHCHNLEDTTEELCNEYCREFRKERLINAFPRDNGSFGIENYIVIFSTSIYANKFAEELSDRTDVIWVVADKYQLKDGSISELTKLLISKTAQNPNIYASIVVGEERDYDNNISIIDDINEGKGKVAYAQINEENYGAVLEKNISIINEWKKEIKELKRQPVPIKGLTIAVHCAGSDWTTALSGNPALGVAADHLVQNGGYVIMDEWAGFPGSEHLLAGHAATRELALRILDKVDETRARYLRETGKTVEESNPVPSNKEAGITTLVEKSTGNIKKAGSTAIQGILEIADKPQAPGVYLQNQDCGGPASTAAYAATSGCHLHVLVTGVGFIHQEVAYLPGIRITGNPETFKNEKYLLDFNAGQSLQNKSLEETGKELFEYIVSVAEGRNVPKNEKGKLKSFAFFYPDDKYRSVEYFSIDGYKEKNIEKINDLKK